MTDEQIIKAVGICRPQTLAGVALIMNYIQQGVFAY